MLVLRKILLVQCISLLSISASAQSFVPTFITYPEDITIECDESVPFPSLIDATNLEPCIIEDVLFTETAIGGEYEVFDVNTADFSGTGISPYGLNSNFVAGASPRYTWMTNAKLFVSDSHAVLRGRVRNADDPSQMFEIFLELVAGQDWDGWNSQLTTGVPFFQRTYRDDLGYAAAGGDLWESWRFFEIDEVESYYGGRNALAGSGGELLHSPPNKSYAFQVGEAANNINTSLGFCTWVNLSGCVEGEENFFTGTISADLVSLGTVEDFYCGDVILRRWTAQDNCGKENTTSQLVYSQNSAAPGDFNGDGLINVDDFISFNTLFGSQCGLCPEDLNEDGFVNIDDFLLFNSLFGN